MNRFSAYEAFLIKQMSDEKNNKIGIAQSILFPGDSVDIKEGKIYLDTKGEYVVREFGEVGDATKVTYIGQASDE